MVSYHWWNSFHYIPNRIDWFCGVKFYYQRSNLILYGSWDNRLQIDLSFDFHLFVIARNVLSDDRKDTFILASKFGCKLLFYFEGFPISHQTRIDCWRILSWKCIPLCNLSTSLLVKAWTGRNRKVTCHVELVLSFVAFSRYPSDGLMTDLMYCYWTVAKEESFHFPNLKYAKFIS